MNPINISRAFKKLLVFFSSFFDLFVVKCDLLHGETLLKHFIYLNFHLMVSPTLIALVFEKHRFIDLPVFEVIWLSYHLMLGIIGAKDILIREGFLVSTLK